MSLLSIVALIALHGCDKPMDPPPSDDLKAPVIKVAPIEIGFGAVELQSDGTTQSFEIANAGTADLGIVDVVVSGQGQGFALSPLEVPFVLAPEEQVSVGVHFAPAVEGEVAGSASVVSDDPDHPLIKVEFQGSGTRYVGPDDTDEPGPTLIDVFLLMDTAYDYSCYHPDLEHFAHHLVEELFDTYDGVAVGLALYDDYVGLGSNSASDGGHPFRVLNLITTDEAALIESADGLRMVYGGDSWGSGYEALYQTAMGPGFDMDCDGIFDPHQDVLPFMASENDAFHGTVGQSYNPAVPGIGNRSGVGWRQGAKHVAIIASDNAFRDTTRGGLPEGSCPDAASSELAIKALSASDVKVLGLNVYEYQFNDQTLQNQLTNLAKQTDSWIDEDGDGHLDDPAVLHGSWNWPEMSNVMRAIGHLAQ